MERYREITRRYTEIQGDLGSASGCATLTLTLTLTLTNPAIASILTSGCASISATISSLCVPGQG